MSERIKMMGRLEYWLGLLYGGLVAAYVAGVDIQIEILLLALMFTLAYFGHWAMMLIQQEQHWSTRPTLTKCKWIFATAMFGV